MNKQPAVAWQRRYAKPLPDGSFADWHEIGAAEFEAGRAADYFGAYEFRALCALDEENAA